MRVLLAYSSEPYYMAPPRLAEAQINCGPFFMDREVAGRWVSLATSRGDYDLRAVAGRLPADQQPDVIVVHVDGSSLAGTPKNIGAFRCPKILLVADTHHGERPISGILKYAQRESFDRVVLLYDRHHADLFRAAGIQNLHWFPALTFAHSDSRIARARARERKALIALVGTTGYHPRRLRAFSALVEHRLPLSWKQIHQTQAIAHYAESSIGLNVSMNGDLNMRVFEVLAGGAMLLADRLDSSSGLSELLQEGREWVAYDSVPELIERSNHFLQHPSEAQIIARAGQQWFDEHFNERRRLEAFRALAFDGRDLPEFALPEKRISFNGGVGIGNVLNVYESLQALHLQREEVTVVIDDSVPEAVQRLASTLPRVRARRGTGTEACDLAIVTHSRVEIATRAERIWAWDAPAEFRLPAKSVAGVGALRRLDEGAAYFGRFVQEAKNPLIESASSALQQGDLQAALQFANHAMKSRPVPVRAFLIMAELSIEAGNWSLAKAMLDRARMVDRGHPQLALLGRDIEMRAPSKQAWRLLSMARRAFDSKAFDQAKGYAFSGLKADPQSAELLHLAGMIIAQAGEGRESAAPLTKVAEGLGYVAQATKLAPERTDFWLDRGVLALRLGRFEEAIECFQLVANHEPSELAFWALGAGHFGLGRNSLAAEAWRNARAAAPEDQQISAALALARERSGVGGAKRERSSSMEEWPGANEREAVLTDIPAILCDSQISSEAATLRLLEIFRAAAERGVSPDEMSALAPRRALLAHQPWFGLDASKTVREGLRQGWLVVLLGDQFAPAGECSWAITRENFRVLSHRGISLWNVCRYQLSLSLCKMPDAIEPEAPNDRLALEGLYTYAVALIDAAVRMVEIYDPETIVIAQGYNVVSAVLREIAIRQGRRVVALENTFNRERLLWDDISGIAVNQNLSRNYYWRYRDQVVAQTADATVNAFLQRMPALKSADHSSPAESPPVERAEHVPTIVYLAQVGLDSSVMFGLSRFASQVDVIMALMRHAIARNQQLLVKLHPKESRPAEEIGDLPRKFTAHVLYHFPGYAALAEQLGNRLLIDTENRYSTHEWIKSADVCVTINSQAGLEAAVLGKEVVLCGDAFYGGLGFTHEAQDAASLSFCLDRILRQEVRCNDGVNCRKFFHIFTELYCVPKTEKDLVSLMAGRPALSRMDACTSDRRASSKQEAA